MTLHENAINHHKMVAIINVHRLAKGIMVKYHGLFNVIRFIYLFHSFKYYRFHHDNKSLKRVKFEQFSKLPVIFPIRALRNKCITQSICIQFIWAENKIYWQNTSDIGCGDHCRTKGYKRLGLINSSA